MIKSNLKYNCFYYVPLSSNNILRSDRHQRRQKPTLTLAGQLVHAMSRGQMTDKLCFEDLMTLGIKKMGNKCKG